MKRLLEIRETVPLMDLFALYPRKNWEHIAATKIAGFLENILGLKLLFEPAPHLLEFGLEAAEPLKIARGLYEEGQVGGAPQHTGHYPDEPRVYRISVGPYSAGSDFFSPTQALWAALAEHIERKRWREEKKWYERSIKFGSVHTLGVPALSPGRIAGFSASQKTQTPELVANDNTEFSWIPTTSLVNDAICYVPVQLMSSHYWRTRRRAQKEPLLRWSVTTGLASGPSLTEAVIRGALEIIERDAFMITYLNRLTPPQLDLAALARADAQIGELLKKFDRYKLAVHLVLLPSDFEVPIVAAVIVDTTGKGPAFSIGAKADFDLRSAILGALSESHSVRLTLKHSTPLPDAFPKKNIKRKERLEYWTDPKRLSQMEFLLSGKRVVPSLTPKAFASERNEEVRKQELKILREQFRKNQADLFYAEIDSDSKAAAEVHTVSAMSPELQPLHLEESMPYVGGSRLTTVPEKLGYTAAQTFNSLPHPFP